MPACISRQLCAVLLLLPIAGCATVSEPLPVTPAAGEVFTDCRDGCPQMVVIPAGSFRMGGEGGEEGRPEWPVHTVTIAHAFALGATEVSVGEYARFIAETGHRPSTDCRSFDSGDLSVSPVPGATFRNPGAGASEGSASMPASCISWSDAQAYVAWLSDRTGQHYRLPSEAEWEYAARAGSAEEYPWGADAAEGCAFANMLDQSGYRAWFAAAQGIEVEFAACDDGHTGAAPVGSFQPNAFGLYDMIGNVWEWTQDCYVAPYPEDAPTDGSAYFNADACERRAVRGGSWITSAFRMRPAWRGRDPVDQVSWIFGFRVARDLAP